MTTKQLIDRSLQLIGSEGYSGMTCVGATPSGAVDALLSTVFAGSTLTDRKNTVRNLLRQQLITVAKLAPGNYRATITPAGAYRISASELNSLIIPTPKSWDNHWRLISYDVPTNKKSERYQLTKHLKRLGCLPLQGSMWVHPYRCELEVSRLADALGLLRYVTIAEVTQFDPVTDTRVRKFFTSISKQ